MRHRRKGWVVKDGMLAVMVGLALFACGCGSDSGGVAYTDPGAAEQNKAVVRTKAWDDRTWHGLLWWRKNLNKEKANANEVSS